MQPAFWTTPMRSALALGWKPPVRRLAAERRGGALPAAD